MIPLLINGLRLSPREIAFIDKTAQRFHRRGAQTLGAFASSSQSDPSSATPPIKSEGSLETDVDGTKTSRTNGQPPTGSPPNGGGAGINNSSSITDRSKSLNSNTTLKLFLSTLALGTGSLITHLTNLLGEDTTRNWAAFMFDGATTFTGALTISSLLAPIGTDNSKIHHV